MRGALWAPVRSPVARPNALVGQARHRAGTTSSTRMGEAHLTRASGVPVTGKGTLFMVFVLDSKKEPLDPCHEARARELLRKGKAAVFRYYPFTIILRERVGGTVSSHRLKLDPGSKATGLAVLQERGSRVVWAAELTHRGQDIRDALLARRAAATAGGSARRATGGYAS
jgi:RRXRR protein